IDPDRLDLRVLLERVTPAFAPEARFFVPSERKARVVEVVGVDPDGPGLELLGGAQSLFDVSRPDRGGEAIDRRVADRDRLGLIPEPERGKHRPENLLPRDR